MKPWKPVSSIESFSRSSFEVEGFNVVFISHNHVISQFIMKQTALENCRVQFPQSEIFFLIYLLLKVSFGTSEIKATEPTVSHLHLLPVNHKINVRTWPACQVKTKCTQTGGNQRNYSCFKEEKSSLIEDWQLPVISLKKVFLKVIFYVLVFCCSCSLIRKTKKFVFFLSLCRLQSQWWCWSAAKFIKDPGGDVGPIDWKPRKYNLLISLASKWWN